MKLPEIKGFIDLSLVDWDGKVSAVIFLPNCNFRCPFCYNAGLVLKPREIKTINYEEVERYLSKNLDYLDGVVITGGEPTIHSRLPELCGRIKELDLEVKLDTNGTNFMMMRNLVAEELVDYIALDVKTQLTLKKYSNVVKVGAESLLKEVIATVDLLRQSSSDYEFRTTLVPTIHDRNDIRRICSRIKGCRKYVLQSFKGDVDTLAPEFKVLKPFSQNEMQCFLEVAKTIVPNTFLR